MPVQRPRRHIIVARLVASFLLVVGLLVAAPADASSGDEQRFIQLINQTRAGAGLGPLTASGELTGQARSWANSMAASDQLAHAPDISRGISAPWTVLGENVGVHGVQDVDQLHAAFVASPGHYANIIDPRYTHVGVGVVVTDEGKLWTAHRFMAVAAAPTTTAPPTTAAPTTTPPTTVAPTTAAPATTSAMPSSTTSPIGTSPTSAPSTVAAPTSTQPSINSSPAFEPTPPPPEARAGTRSTTTTTTVGATAAAAAATAASRPPATETTSAIADADPDEQAPAPIAPNDPITPIVPRDLDGWPNGADSNDGGVKPVVAGPDRTDVDTVEQMLLDLIEAGI